MKQKFTNIIFFMMGFFSIIDWIPYFGPSIIGFVRNIFLILFILVLILRLNAIRISGISISILLLTIFVIIRTLFSDLIVDQIYLNGLLLFLVLIQKKTNFEAILNGFLFAGFCNIFYMLSVNFGFLNIDRSWIGDIVQYGEWFIENNLVSIGLINKYNRLSYLFSIFLFFYLNQKYKVPIINFLVVTAVIYCQLLTGGRGGLYCSLILIFFYFFRKFNFKTISVFILLAITILFYIEPILQTLEDYRGLEFLNKSTESRIAQYNFVYENFTKNFWFGSGYYFLNSFNTPFIYIHNYFLNNLLMGGITAFLISLKFAWDILSTFIKNFKGYQMIYLIVLFAFQFTVENFNLISVIGSYLIVWIYITKKINSNENWSNHSFLQQRKNN